MSSQLPPRPELPAGIDRPPVRSPLPAWPLWSPFAALLLAFAVAIAGATVITVVAQLAGADFDPGDAPPGVTIGGTTIQDAALIAAAVIFARVSTGVARARDFGLRKVRLGPAVGWLAAAWAAFFAFSAVYAAVFDVTSDDDLPKELGADDSTLNLLLVMGLVCVVAPIAEEFFFRGFFYGTLRTRLSTAWAVLINGAVFGAIHASTGVSAVPALIFLGIVLCLVREKTGSLYPCIAIHAFNNALAYASLTDVEPAIALGLGAAMIGACALLPRFAWREGPATA